MRVAGVQGELTAMESFFFKKKKTTTFKTDFDTDAFYILFIKNKDKRSLIEKLSPEQQQESNIAVSHSHLVFPGLRQLDPVNPDLGLFFFI